MSRFDSFVATYINKATDYDGVYGVQCVDLIKLYLNKVFGIKAGSWGDARRYYEMFGNTEWGGFKQMNAAFVRIKNTRSFVPQKGDICIWNGNISSSHDCGHISIATGEGNTKTFYSYDQNWGGKPMARVSHNYGAFYGVLRPRNQSLIVDSVTSPPATDKPTEGGVAYKVMCTSLNVRKGAGTVYGVVGYVRNGQRVTVYEKKGSWGRIGVNRWVSLKYLEQVG